LLLYYVETESLFGRKADIIKKKRKLANQSEEEYIL